MASDPNVLWRRAIVDSIKTDPEWHGGEYRAPPSRGLISAEYAALGLSSNPLLTYKQAPTAARADQLLEEAIQRITKADANDLLYVVDASRDYNPEPHLGDIEARVIAINSADDPINPPELGLMELKIKRVKQGTYILIPRSDETVGHETYLIAKFFKGYIAELLTAK